MREQKLPFYKSVPFKNFQDLVAQSATNYPDKVAFRFVVNKQDKSVTYKEHQANTIALGTALAHRGYHGVHIALVGDNSYEWALTQITILGSDNVLVPVDKELPLNDLLNVVNHSDSKVVICIGAFSKLFADNIDKIPNVELIVCCRPKDELPEGFVNLDTLLEEGTKLVSEGNIEYTSQEPEEMALGEIVYTSGTTGDPKGVMLSRHNVKSSVYYGMMQMKVMNNNLSILPYNHTYEATCDLLVSQHEGSTININESLKAVANNFKKYKPDYVMLVPLFVETFYKKIWKTLEKDGSDVKLKKLINFSNGLRKIGIDLRGPLFKKVREIFGGNLKMIVCGGAPIRPELAFFFDAINIDLINGYGITECSPLLAVNRLDYNDYHSVGILLPCVDARIEDPNEEGEGEIVVKGDIVMMGYYKNPEATAEVLTEDGWFATGDYGKFVGDRLYITGRKKNLIVLQNGKNVYPEEIEDYIAGIEGVEELMVYSNLGENGDEVSLCAEIYPAAEFKEGKSKEELEKYFKSQCAIVCKPLPAYKQIATVVIRDTEFPKTTTKKIKRMLVLKERRG